MKNEIDGTFINYVQENNAKKALNSKEIKNKLTNDEKINKKAKNFIVFNGFINLWEEHKKVAIFCSIVLTTAALSLANKIADDVLLDKTKEVVSEIPTFISGGADQIVTNELLANHYLLKTDNGKPIDADMTIEQIADYIKEQGVTSEEVIKKLVNENAELFGFMYNKTFDSKHLSNQEFLAHQIYLIIKDNVGLFDGAFINEYLDEPMKIELEKQFKENDDIDSYNKLIESTKTY